MRGIIGYGTNMMNVYTVRRATKGLAEYIKTLGSSAMRRGVAISYDTRNMSELFARETAGVLAANGIRVYAFKKASPVPMLSFAVRHYDCIAYIRPWNGNRPSDNVHDQLPYHPGCTLLPSDEAKESVGYFTASRSNIKSTKTVVFVLLMLFSPV